MAESTTPGSMLIAALIRHAVERPSDCAIREGGSRSRQICWLALDVVTRELAMRMRRTTTRSMVIIAPNCIEMVVGLLAGLRCGITVLPLAPDLPLDRVCQLTRGLAPDVWIAPAAIIEGVDLGPSVLRIPLGSVEIDATACVRADDDDDAGGALLLPTSGTTGMPKLVRRDAAALDAVGNGCIASIGVRPDDRMLLAVPLYHSYGIDLGLLTAIRAGCAVELHDGFDLGRIRTSLRSGGTTILPGVPFLFDLLARSASGGIAEAPSLRVAISAGGPLPRSVFDEFRTRFGVAIGQIYGATEFGSITYADPRSANFVPGSAGRPFAHVELRILDPDAPDPDRPLGVGVEGQVAVSSRSMLNGYADATNVPFVGGFFLTGDLGCVNADGMLHLSGRIALLIDVGGRKVNPVEVEAALESHPEVQEAAVVAVPYSRTVHRLRAIVVPRSGCAPRAEQLRRHLRSCLPPHAIPRSFQVRGALPRSATGKLLRNELRNSDEASR